MILKAVVDLHVDGGELDNTPRGFVFKIQASVFEQFDPTTLVHKNLGSKVRQFCKKGGQGQALRGQKSD